MMPESQSKQTRRTLLRGATLALAGGLAGCTSIMDSDGSSPKSNQTSSPSGTTSTETSMPGTSTEAPSDGPEGSFPFMHSATGTTKFDVKLDQSPVMGSNDAPVDLYYWSDYLCPFCETFATKIHPKIAKSAVADGTLRVVFLQLPNIGENSFPAALMAKCVWRQVADDDPDLFWKWHHAVFEQQGEEGSGWADIKNLYKITEDVGIDTDAITTCIENRQDAIRKDIKAEVNVADREKIKGTPAFIFYNRKTGTSKKLAGAQPYATFKQAIQTVQNG